MSLRSKVVLTLVAVSALATLAIGVVSYRSTAAALRSAVDESLAEAAQGTVGRLRDSPRAGERFFQQGPPPDEVRGRGDVIVQLLRPDGASVPIRGAALPVSAADVAVAAAPGRAQRVDTVDVGGAPVRVLTRALGRSRGAVQVGRSLAEVDAVLGELRGRIVVAALAVAALAGLVGALVVRGLTARLERLTRAAEEVAGTGRLDVEVPGGGSDEAGRLAGAFDAMLVALARSREDQRRLVQDAGHELRTPLTSLRTNVYALRHADRLDPAERARVLDDLESETQELSSLVDEIVELATDQRSEEPPVEVALGEPVARVAARVQRRTGREVVVTDDGSVVLGRPAALERAVQNLVDNAVKFDPSGAPVEVTVTGGAVWVADRGPGIEAAEAKRVFDRFHRSDAARSLPGSGLGLAIVRDVAERHGGSAEAHPRPGGGAVVGLRLPLAR